MVRVCPVARSRTRRALEGAGACPCENGAVIKYVNKGGMTPKYKNTEKELRQVASNQCIGAHRRILHSH